MSGCSPRGMKIVSMRVASRRSLATRILATRNLFSQEWRVQSERPAKASTPDWCSFLHQ